MSKFAILVAGPTADWMFAKYGEHGYAVLFETTLSDPERNETWDYFSAFDGKLPQNVEDYDGYVITGSKLDAHSEDPWILSLSKFCLEAFSKNKRIYGCCFGHQLLSNVFGGLSGRAQVGWEIGSVPIQFILNSDEYSQQQQQQLKQEFKEKIEKNGLNSFLSEFNRIFANGKMNLLASHRDQVLELPKREDCILWLSSKRCPIEMYTVGKNVLCIQGHPEWTVDHSRILIELRMKEQIFSEELAQNALNSLKTNKPDSESMNRLIKFFLKNKF